MRQSNTPTFGLAMVASRYSDDAAAPPLSLHYTAGSRYVCDDAGCRMTATSSRGQAVLIASEPLTRETEHWDIVPPNQFVLVDADDQVTLRPIEAAVAT